MSVRKKMIKELEGYLDVLIKEAYVPKEYNVEEFSEYKLINRTYESLVDTKEFLKSDILNECFSFYLQEMTYRVTGEGITDLAKEMFLFVDLYGNENLDEATIANALNQMQFC